MVFRPNRNAPGSHRRSQSASGTDQIPPWPPRTSSWIAPPIVPESPRTPVEHYGGRPKHAPTGLDNKKNSAWNWRDSQDDSSALSTPAGPATFFPLENPSSSTLFLFAGPAYDVLLLPLHFIRFFYRQGSRYFFWGGRRARRLLDPVFRQFGDRLDFIPWFSSSRYRLLPTTPTLQQTARASKIAFWFPFFLICFIFILIGSSVSVISEKLRAPSYVQGLSVPVNVRDPNHQFIRHVGHRSATLDLSPDNYGRHDIYRIDYSHPHSVPAVPVYKHVFYIKQGYEGFTAVYESIARNNSRVVIKRFFRTTRSEAVTRDVKMKILREAQALNLALTGNVDWTSGMSNLSAQGNFWGWESRGFVGQGDVRTEEDLRRRQMEWPVEVRASLRQYTPFKEVMEQIIEKQFSPEELKAMDVIERPKNSVEFEQEEGEIIQIQDIFYTPDFEVMQLPADPWPKSKDKPDQPTEYELLVEELEGPKPSATTSLTPTESVMGTLKFTSTRAERDGKQKRGIFGRNSWNTPVETGVPNALTERKPKRLLWNKRSDIESWAIALPFMEGGDLDHLIAILPVLGLSAADLDWLYRPLYLNGVWKSIARMHHTKEDREDRLRLRADIAQYGWYTEKGSGAHGDNGEREPGIHGIPKVRRPQRLDDYDEGYCHGDVKLDNIFIRRIPEPVRKSKKKGLGMSARPESYLDQLRTAEDSEPLPSTKHYLILSDLSQVRPIHHRWFISSNYRDCRITDVDRAWRSYLTLLRMGSRTRPEKSAVSPTKHFDDIWMKWRQIFIDNDGRIPKSGLNRPSMPTDPNTVHKKHQKRKEPKPVRQVLDEDPEAFISAYFMWLTEPVIPSVFFLPSGIHTNPPTPQAYWGRKLPETRLLSIAGAPARHLTRGQVFAALDHIKAEMEIIQGKKRNGAAVQIPSWYWEPGGSDRMRPDDVDEPVEEETLTEIEEIVAQGLQTVGAYLLGM